jgi:peptidyl-tRNA hydrolase
MNYRHYIIVRRDLPPGVTAAQTTHAAGESFAAYVERWGKRPDEPTYAIVLAVPTERQLKALEKKLKTHRIRHEAIREPDEPWNGALMAIGLQPVCPTAKSVRAVLKNYPLL